MRRPVILTMAFAIVSMMFIACGGGGGGGGGGTADVLREIALFINGTYVDYIPGDPIAEASNLEDALRDMGHTVTPFTGTTPADFASALSGKRVLVIPELENGNLNSILDPAARTEISNFVNNGGILVAGNDDAGYLPALLNASFGFSMAYTDLELGGTLTLNASEVAGTPFEDAVPATLLGNDAVYTLATSSLPSKAKNIYSDPDGDACLVYIPVGKGHVVILGWDWYDGKPAGYQDDGWWGILYRAAAIGANFPDAAVLHAHLNTSWSYDIVSKLKESGQFGTVDRVEVTTSTPTLSTIRPYDALVVSSDSGFANATSLGNRLADYVDGGGGAVIAHFSFGTLLGRFSTDNYFSIPGGTGTTSGTPAYLGTTYYTAHPTLAGVLDFFGGTSSYRANTPNVVAGATRIANWDDGNTFLATREINGVRRADLGFYPVSVDMRSDFWDTATDGALLLANALTWVTDLAEPSFTTNSASPGLSIDSPAGLNCTQQSIINLSGGPESISKVRVELDITHSYIWDLTIELESPDGTTIALTDNNGGAGEDMTDTVFDDWAGRSIVDSVAGDQPFIGRWIPQESLADYRGEDANGSWTLTVTDDGFCGLDGGTFDSWRIMVR